MSRLTRRVAALERQTARRRGHHRCHICRDWASTRVAIIEIDVDGVETRHDRLEEPVECPGCGWSPIVYEVTLEEVRDWDRVGRHGLD